MASVLTVSQLNKYVAFKLSSDIKLKGVAVKGEISNFVCHFRSGHMYFTLKDGNSQVKAVMFSSNASRLRFEPIDGMNVMAVCNIELYERDGLFQIIVTELVALGAGAVNDKIERLKKKLLDNGIIDESNKKLIPLVPKKLAVVTSADAAALRDVLTVTQRRYPLCAIEIYPALVQGEGAVQSICDALKAADKNGADTIILTRGGGSAEDLMAFNSEQVAMAVYECETPIVTAVGHETDTTIVDYVSDMRAPTPSAAAEICTPDKSDLLGSVRLLEYRLNKALESIIDSKATQLSELNVQLKDRSPEMRLERIGSLLEKQTIELRHSMNSKLIRAEGRLSKNFGMLNALSPFGVLERGYAIATRDKKVIDDPDSLEKGDSIQIRTRNALIGARIETVDRIKE